MTHVYQTTLAASMLLVMLVLSSCQPAMAKPQPEDPAKIEQPLTQKTKSNPKVFLV